jgi:hypothetical protein
MTNPSAIQLVFSVFATLFMSEIRTPESNRAESARRAAVFEFIPWVANSNHRLLDCLTPTRGTARDTLQLDRTRTGHDLTRPDTTSDGRALQLIGEFLERCLGTRRELFLAREASIAAEIQSFLVGRRPLGPSSSRTLKSPEARAYLITIDRRKLVVLGVREFR